MVARALILVAMMTAAGVYASGASGDEVPVARTPLSDLPAGIEAWQGRDAKPFDDDVVAALGVDDYINRSYERDGAAAGRAVRRLLRQSAAGGHDSLAAELPAGRGMAARVLGASDD